MDGSMDGWMDGWMDGRKEGYLFGKKNKNEGSPVPFHIQPQVGEKGEGRKAPVNAFTC